MIRLNKVAIRDALRSANLLTKTSEEKLCEAVGETISFWIPEKLDFLPIRGQHNHLKGIWKLVHDADPPIALIPSRFKKLPYSSRFYLRRRASLLQPRVFKLESNCDPYPYIERMGRKRLLRRLPKLIAEGGYVRKDNSEAIEPTILGITRGLNDGPIGGRPRGDDELRLVTYLAFDWKYATGELPRRGRNTEEGFGELVRHVFSWTTGWTP